MNVSVTHVEAGAGAALKIETDQDIPIWIRIEDVWAYRDSDRGAALVSVVGQNGVGHELRMEKSPELPIDNRRTKPTPPERREK